MELKNKRWSKNRINVIHYSYEQFTSLEMFIGRLLGELTIGTSYSLLVRVKYNEGKYGMLSTQKGFNYASDLDIEYLKGIYADFIELLEAFEDKYDVYKVQYMQLLYVPISDLPKLKTKNINSIKLNKNFVKVKETKDRFKYIPLTINENYFGKRIVKDKDVYLEKINKQKLILREDKINHNDIDSMYLYKDKYIIINKKYDDNTYHRYIYSSNLGLLLSKVVDKIINENSFVRSINNVKLTMNNGEITRVEANSKLTKIKFNQKNISNQVNSRIGSWDVEAFEDSDGIAKVYALGFTVVNGKPYTYYINKEESSEDLVLRCIDDMVVGKYDGYTFYTHNFGKYDSIFLLKILVDANSRLGYTHYDLKTTAREDNLLKLRIRVKREFIKKQLQDNDELSSKELNNGLSSQIVEEKNKSNKPKKIQDSKEIQNKESSFVTINIVDSINLLDGKLSSLASSFDLNMNKGNFPYKFVRKETLYYKGNTPSYEYWEGIDFLDYNNLVTDNWDLKGECLKYLELDLVILLNVMEKFSGYIFRKYGLQITDCLTISRLALNIYLKYYLEDHKIPVIPTNMYGDIKQAYYGGITEVYKPYGENLYYYDVNSLYPFAALNNMPGTNCSFIENIDGSFKLEDSFGYFYCEVETTNDYLGLLPVRTESGIIMPKGKWFGWYFSEELKLALENNYKIKLIKGYNFDKQESFFKDYIYKLYTIKSTTKDSVEKSIAKRLLNHLLGRLGMNINKPNSGLISTQDFSLICSTRRLQGAPKIVGENSVWLSYYPEIDKEICEDHGIDYIKALELSPRTKVEEVNTFKDVSITTAAAVTSYARIFMSKVKLDIIKKGGKIYYTDTDSIVTDIPLDDNAVGESIGQFKLEYKICKGYFISNKLYCIQGLDVKSGKEKTIIKAKGALSELIKANDFEDLLNGIDIVAKKRFGKTDLNKGSVIIKTENITLRYNSYTKRSKVYKDDLWIDTKPLFYNTSFVKDEEFKSLQLFIPKSLQLFSPKPLQVIPFIKEERSITLSKLEILSLCPFNVEEKKPYLIIKRRLNIDHKSLIIYKRPETRVINQNLIIDYIYIKENFIKEYKSLELYKLYKTWCEIENTINRISRCLNIVYSGIKGITCTLFWLIIIGVLYSAYVADKIEEGNLDELNIIADNYGVEASYDSFYSSPIFLQGNPFSDSLKEIPSGIRKYFRKFIDLFKEDSNKIYNKSFVHIDQFHNNNFIDKSINSYESRFTGDRDLSSNNVNEGSHFTDKLIEEPYKFNSAIMTELYETEINRLNIEISMIELEYIRYRISSLDTINAIKSALDNKIT